MFHSNHPENITHRVPWDGLMYIVSLLLIFKLVDWPETVIFTDQWTFANPNLYIRMCKNIKLTLEKNNYDEFGQVNVQWGEICKLVKRIFLSNQKAININKSKMHLSKEAILTAN